jgi:hypothetical protein
MFSAQSWKRWWRKKKYIYYKSLISEVDENKKVKKTCLNLGGWLIPEANVQHTKLAIETLEEEKTRLKAQREDKHKKLVELQQKQDEMIKNYGKKVQGIMSKWSKTDKELRNRQAMQLKTDPSYKNFTIRYNNNVKQINQEQRTIQLIDTKIISKDNVIAGCNNALVHMESGDESFDVKEHFKTITSILEGVAIAEVDTTGTTEASIRFDTVLENLNDRQALAAGMEDMGSGVANAQTQQADDRQFAEMLRILSSVGKDQEEDRVSTRSKSTPKSKNGLTEAALSVAGDSGQDIQYSSNDQQGYDQDEEEDDDDDDLLFSNKVKSQTASLLKKHDSGKKSMFAVNTTF